MSNDGSAKQAKPGRPDGGTGSDGSADAFTALRFDPGAKHRDRARVAESRQWLHVKRCAALADIGAALSALQRLQQVRPGRDVAAMIADLSAARCQIEALDPNELPSADALVEISLRLQSRLESFRDQMSPAPNSGP